MSWHSHILPREKAYEAETGQGVESHNPDKIRHFVRLMDFVDDNSIIIKLEDLVYNNAALCMITATKKCMEI